MFVEEIQPQILLVQKIARNLALTLLLISVVIPFTQVINLQAQNSNPINPDSKVTVEKVMKDDTREIKELTVAELNKNEELVNSGKFNQTEEARHLDLTAEKIKQIESQLGVAYEKNQAVIQQPVLLSLGYNSEQINLIQSMVDFYNSQTIKLVNIKFDNQKISNNSNFLSVQVQAACTPQIDTKWEWWGSRTVLDGCGVNQFKWNYTQASIIIGLIGLSPCSVLCGLVAANYALIAGALEYRSNQCEGKGAILSLLYIGVWNVDPIC